MLFYISIFAASVSITLLSKKKKAVILSLLILWALFAFRNEVGMDDRAYIQAFESINLGWDYEIEWTFKLISHIATFLGFNYKFVFLIYSTISFTFIGLSIKLLFNNNIYVALFLSSFLGLAFVPCISVMRQFLSASICFYAFIIYIMKDKKMLGILLCIIATFFHDAAFISIPILIFFPKFKISYFTKITILLLCVVLGYLNFPNVILNLIFRFLPIGFQVYENAITGSFSSAGGTVSLLLLVLFIFQCYYSMKEKKQYPSNTKIDLLEKGQLLYLSILFFFVDAGVTSRLAFTFIPFIATLPYTLLFRFRKEDRLIIIFLFIFIMFILYILTLNNVSNIMIPYDGSFNIFK